MLHLHLHTSGSELDGAININNLIDKVIEQGSNAVGISDHGSMVKTYEFYSECKKKGVKPIIGCEFYCGESDDKNTYHLVLHAKNNIGLKNLYKLVHKSYNNFYSKPRISMYDLEQHKEGLICSTACLGSELADMYKKNVDSAISHVAYLKSLFGNDLYLEIQPNSTNEQKAYNLFILTLCKMGYKPVVTCDAHYLNKEDWDSHDTLLCMSTKKKKDDVKRMRFPTKDCYIKTEQEVKDSLTYLPSDFVELSIKSTHEIADKCDVTIEYKDLNPSMNGIDNPNKRLAELCNIGLQRRISQGAYKGIDINIVIKRIQDELKIMCEKKFSAYFLIIEDFFRWCREKHIFTGIGRGSACGSEIAYVIGITEVEPIRYGLLFERFINPTRDGYPDL